MPNYQVLSPVKFEGKVHGVGSKLPMTEEQAKELVTIFSLILATSATATNPKPNTTTTNTPTAMDEAEVIEEIAAVLSQLKQDDFKNDGHPKVRAVEALLKGQVDPSLISATQVNAAWQSYSPEKPNA